VFYLWINGNGGEPEEITPEACPDDNLSVSSGETESQWTIPAVNTPLDWKVVALIGAIILLAGVALGSFAERIFPFETTQDAISKQAASDTQFSRVNTDILALSTRVQDLEKSRSEQMEANGRMEAELDAISKQDTVIEQELMNIQQEQARVREKGGR
jgi:septal ring factor EnvC (AmiA/AmiB activator)